MIKYEFTVFADYFQFELIDDGVDFPADQWNDQTIVDRVAVSQGVITIVTARDTSVPVVVEVHELPKDQDADIEATKQWDHIVECAIEIASGRLVILGNEYYPDAPRIIVSPGIYQTRVYYGGLSTLSDDGREGDDIYKIVLWPGKYHEPKVIKRYSPN
jgi:hypothetical protein